MQPEGAVSVSDSLGTGVSVHRMAETMNLYCFSPSLFPTSPPRFNCGTLKTDLLCVCFLTVERNNQSWQRCDFSY